ncbi:hypothetical protein FIBSPDRAFT_1042469, partial [Athelia psychrophila]
MTSSPIPAQLRSSPIDITNTSGHSPLATDTSASEHQHQSRRRRAYQHPGSLRPLRASGHSPPIPQQASQRQHQSRRHGHVSRRPRFLRPTTLAMQVPRPLFPFISITSSVSLLTSSVSLVFLFFLSLPLFRFSLPLFLL